jgi:hypothetical protein
MASSPGGNVRSSDLATLRFSSSSKRQDASTRYGC